MDRKRKLIAVAAVVLAIVVAVLAVKMVKKNNTKEKLIPARPERGDISLVITTTGKVKPQNRLAIKPPINGRIEKILVDEGQTVRTGDILALMSSTDRATLIDAARLQGDAEYKYWQRVYRETPLIAPINGVVIVRKVEPGQTIITSDSVLVLSDRLIVEADVDETDIGEVKVGQRAEVVLDAYPQIKIGAVVDHKDYESQVVNNVTIYKVDILPDEIPEVFRSGMSANLDIIVKDSKNALIVPVEAVERDGEKTYIMASTPPADLPQRTEVRIGIESKGEVEVISGITENDTIYVPQSLYSVPKKQQNGSNPFMPQMKKKDETPPK